MVKRRAARDRRAGWRLWIALPLFILVFVWQLPWFLLNANHLVLQQVPTILHVCLLAVATLSMLVQLCAAARMVIGSAMQVVSLTFLALCPLLIALVLMNELAA